MELFGYADMHAHPHRPRCVFLHALDAQILTSPNYYICGNIVIVYGPCRFCAAFPYIEVNDNMD